MTDIVTPQTRSRMMSGIRGKNTKPELQVRRYLHNSGFRYRLHVKDMAGKPDIVLPKWSAVVFVHGCFWHRHLDCRYSTTPATRTSFWQKKFDDNVERDQRHLDSLEMNGWRLAIVWECGLKGLKAETTCRNLVCWLTSKEIARFETPPTKVEKVL